VRRNAVSDNLDDYWGKVENDDENIKPDGIIF
jgi:hypothetical protein